MKGFNGKNSKKDSRYQILKEYWEKGTITPEADQEKTFHRLMNRIQDQEDRGKTHPFQVMDFRETNTNKRKRLFRILMAAASMAVILVMVYLLYHRLEFDYNHLADKSEWIQKNNSAGRMSTIILGDGTKVKLNAESEIFYPKRFSDNLREVRLIGEAYFEVKHNPEKPFIITTGNLKTKVLGTKFNIRAYSEEEKTTVALESGKVEVEIQNNASVDRVLLKPTEMLVYNKGDQESSKTNFDPDEVLGWKDGILFFKDAGFDEIQEKLERWYGVHVVIKNGKNIKRRFTGSFKNKSLDLVLQGIGFASHFNSEIKEDTVFIDNNMIL